ncbi:unnamed protein product [Lathyrus oleraceus]
MLKSKVLYSWPCLDTTWLNPKWCKGCCYRHVVCKMIPMVMEDWCKGWWALKMEVDTCNQIRYCAFRTCTTCFIEM